MKLKTWIILILGILLIAFYYMSTTPSKGSAEDRIEVKGIIESAQYVKGYSNLHLTLKNDEHMYMFSEVDSVFASPFLSEKPIAVTLYYIDHFNPMDWNGKVRHVDSIALESGLD